MYGFNAYGNYGYGNANPPPPPPPAGTATFAQQVAGAVPTTNYSNTQFSYPTAASAYAQFGATATQQQTASSMAGYGQQPQAAAAEAPGTQPAATGNFVAGGRGGGTTGGANSGVNSIPLGYEQAVFAAASSYLQAKNTNKTNTWMGGKRGGGGGAGGFRGASGPNAAKKRYGLGHQNREPQQQFFCEVCKITCAGNQTYKEHLEGKAHKKKEAMSKGTTVQSLPRNKVSFKCDVCNVTCTGRDTYDAHVKGVKHQKTIALMKKWASLFQQWSLLLFHLRICLLECNWHQVVGGSKLNTTGAEAVDNGMEQALLAESNIKPVGQEFIEEHKEPSGSLATVASCGRRHRLQYKQKINPTLEVEFKVPNNKWNKRGQREDYFNAPQMYRPHPMGNGPHQMRPMFQMPMGQSQESSDDRHVVAKNDSIHPSKAEMNSIEQLVAMVERTLKNISDKFAEEDKAAQTDKTVEPERLLKGVMRVGLLAKNLLLSSDKEVDLICDLFLAILRRRRASPPADSKHSPSMFGCEFRKYPISVAPADGTTPGSAIEKPTRKILSG
uniref:DZF domain-containing protein n=1 Tax=Ditylenchus dipsaci TaxID=166011 RepID=A0A915DEP2_9BILA